MLDNFPHSLLVGWKSNARRFPKSLWGKPKQTLPHLGFPFLTCANSNPQSNLGHGMLMSTCAVTSKCPQHGTHERGCSFISAFNQDVIAGAIRLKTASTLCCQDCNDSSCFAVQISFWYWIKACGSILLYTQVTSQNGDSTVPGGTKRLWEKVFGVHFGALLRP